MTFDDSPQIYWHIIKTAPTEILTPKNEKTHEKLTLWRHFKEKKRFQDVKFGLNPSQLSEENDGFQKVKENSVPIILQQQLSN